MPSGKSHLNRYTDATYRWRHLCKCLPISLDPSLISSRGEHRLTFTIPHPHAQLRRTKSSTTTPPLSFIRLFFSVNLTHLLHLQPRTISLSLPRNLRIAPPTLRKDNMGLRRKLFYKSVEPEGHQRSWHALRRNGRSVIVPVPPPAPVGQRRSTTSTLNARIPRFTTTSVQRRMSPPPYTVIDAGDRLPRHPQPGSICTNPPSRPQRSNHIAYSAKPSRVPTGIPLKRSSASLVATQAPRDAHENATLRQYQSTNALPNTTRPTARHTSPSFVASTHGITVRRVSQLDAIRLGRRSSRQHGQEEHQPVLT